MIPKLNSAVIFDKISFDNDNAKDSVALFDPIMHFLVIDFPIKLNFALYVSVGNLTEGHSYQVEISLINPSKDIILKKVSETVCYKEHPKIEASAMLVLDMEIENITEEGVYTFDIIFDAVSIGEYNFSIYKRVENV